MQHPYPEILSVKQSYAADAQTIVSGIAGHVLMENAGKAAADYILAHEDKVRTLILCGPGNNAGDGFVVARYLKSAGWPVEIITTIDLNAYQGDAKKMADQWDGEVLQLNPDISLASYGLVVDAIFGIGFNRSLPVEIAAVFDKIKTTELPVIALDIPSGMDGDTGRMDATTLKAKTTITFGNKKPAHVIYPSRDQCGNVICVDIGIPYEVVIDQKSDFYENMPCLWQKCFPQKTAEKHKYDYGCVTVFGGAELTGAAVMAADAAMRIGAGAAMIAAPAKARTYYQLSGHENLMLSPLSNSEDVTKLLSSKQAQTVIVGPGNGRAEDVIKNVCAILFDPDRRVVIDADAISVFEGCADILLKQTSENHVLTPHAGEFKRLFPELAHLPKIEQAKEAAKISQATLILKGADTMIAHPDGRLVVNTNAPPYLATAGAGDVLAGIVGGLLAQNMPVFEAACAAVWLHGAAAERFGVGLVATDLPEILPELLQEYGFAEQNKR